MFLFIRREPGEMNFNKVQSSTCFDIKIIHEFENLPILSEFRSANMIVEVVMKL